MAPCVLTVQQPRDRHCHETTRHRVTRSRAAFLPLVLAGAEGQARRSPTHVSAVIKSASSSSPSVQYLNGLWERSTRAIVSVMILVPNRSLRRVSKTSECQSGTEYCGTWSVERGTWGEGRRAWGVERGASRSPLRAELVHHLGTCHAVREPGEVLDLGGGGELASWGEAVGGEGSGGVASVGNCAWSMRWD
jgi:hypothetical protein